MAMMNEAMPPNVPAAFAARTRARVSLCMIVKNEADKLERCLRAAMPWVGEAIVVDTGSTDDTVAIAERLGARVVHLPWQGDFAAARNASLEAASLEWALVLDGDEVLEVIDPEEFARAVEQTVIDGFSFRCHNVMDDGAISIASIFRLFRRSMPTMRYRGQIHEQVIAVSDGGAPTAALGCCVIRHDGYTQEAFDRHDKVARNIALSKALVAERPEDPFAWHCLGLSQARADIPGMVESYEKALALLGDPGAEGADGNYVMRMYYELLLGYRSLNQPDKAEARLARGLELFPIAPDLLFERAKLRFNARDFAGAAADAEACLSPESRGFYCVLNPASIADGARTTLALALLNLGRNQEAEAALEQAVAEAPAASWLPRRALGTLRLQRGDWHGALPLLEAAVAAAPGDEESRFACGWCLYKLGRLEAARERLLPLAERPDVQHLLGQVALELGEADEALRLLSATPLPAAGLARGWAYMVAGHAREAAACWDDWMRAGAADWGTKDALATFLFLMQGGRPPSGQPERPAEPVRDMDQWFRLLLRYERFDEVEAIIQRGPELGAPLWPLLRSRFAITLAKESHYDVALALLLEAREAAPDEAELYYWIGCCAVGKRHLDDARLMWQTCLQLAPAHALARESLSLLD